MKKALSIALIVILGLGLFFSQALAFGTRPVVNTKPTPKSSTTTEFEQNQTDQGNKPDKTNKLAGKKYNFNGVVVSYASGSLVLTDKRGQTITVALDANTIIKIAGSKDATTDIQPDARVIVQAVKAENQTFRALRVVVVPGKPKHVHRVGEVTAYEVGVSITVKDSKGSTTFQIAPDIKILPADRAGELKVGARVTIISPRNPSSDKLLAKGIVVHPTK